MSTPHTGYCMRCKDRRRMKGACQAESKGRAFMKGTCEDCGTKMSRAMGKVKESSPACPQCERHSSIPDGDYICVQCRNEV